MMRGRSKNNPRYPRYYVYHLIDPRTNEVFYIGKGIKDRAATSSQGGNMAKDARIMDIEDAGHVVAWRIVKYFPDELSALMYESLSIHTTPGLTNSASEKRRAERLVEALRVARRVGNITSREDFLRIGYKIMGSGLGGLTRPHRFV